MKLQILVPLQSYPEGYPRSIASFAAAVGRHLDAELHALVLIAEFPQLSSLIGDVLVDTSAMIADAEARSRACGAALLRALRAETGKCDVPLRSTELKCLPATFGDAAGRRARYSDMVLLGWSAVDPAFPETAELTVFGSGRPALLVPEGAAEPSFERVMIAWDGSRAAARAVADARDFLDRAQAITVVSVTDEKPVADGRPAARLAEYLQRGGRQVTVEEIRGGDRPIAAVLQDHARNCRAGLMVMGAFGHSRFREFILGGATRGVLRKLELPVLLSH